MIYLNLHPVMKSHLTLRVHRIDLPTLDRSVAQHLFRERLREGDVTFEDLKLESSLSTHLMERMDLSKDQLDDMGLYDLIGKFEGFRPLADECLLMLLVPRGRPAIEVDRFCGRYSKTFNFSLRDIQNFERLNAQKGGMKSRKPDDFYYVWFVSANDERRDADDQSFSAWVENSSGVTDVYLYMVPSPPYREPTDTLIELIRDLILKRDV